MIRVIINKIFSKAFPAALLFFVLLTIFPVNADEVSEEGGKSCQKYPQPVQLGISVAKPSKSIHAQLPMLPRGSGFILESVVEGGAAEAAGLASMDVIWKLDDQLLINEGQLAVLLGMYKVGDSAKIHYFRSGKLKSVDVVLSTPATMAGAKVETQTDLPFVNPPNLGMRVISYEDKSATISDDNGTATLSYIDGNPWLTIESKAGEEVFSAQVLTTKEKYLIPAPWNTRLITLQHSLEQSVRMRRLPRVRRVPVRRTSVTKP